MKIIYGVGWALVFAVLVALAMKALERPNDVKVAHQQAAIRVVDSIVRVRTETVTVHQRSVAHFDTLVRNISDTQVVIQREKPDTVTLPIEVIARDTAKDHLILSLYQRDTTRVEQIAHRDSLLALLKPASKWSLGMTGGYGCNSKGCGPSVTFGVSWRP